MLSPAAGFGDRLWPVAVEATNVERHVFVPIEPASQVELPKKPVVYATFDPSGLMSVWDRPPENSTSGVNYSSTVPFWAMRTISAFGPSPVEVAIVPSSACDGGP